MGLDRAPCLALLALPLEGSLDAQCHPGVSLLTPAATGMLESDSSGTPQGTEGLYLTLPSAAGKQSPPRRNIRRSAIPEVRGEGYKV